MDTPTIQAHIKHLQSQVQPYQRSSKSSVWTWKDIYREGQIYIAIPVAILVIFITIRPGFLYYEDPAKKNRTWSWLRVLVFTVLFSTILSVGIYAYNYKQKTTE
jgi:hypothetical protein